MASRVVKTKIAGWDVSMSKVTLALFEDSGWYLPDYDMADRHIKGADWGYKQGCNFARGLCVKKDGNGKGVTDFPQIWCTSPSERACSLDRKSEAACSLSTFPAFLTQRSPVSYLPSVTQTGSLP